MAHQDTIPSDPKELRRYAETREHHWRSVREACDLILRVHTEAPVGVNGQASSESRQTSDLDALGVFLRRRPKPPVRQQGLAVLLFLGPQRVRGLLDGLEAAGYPIRKKRPQDIMRNSIMPEVKKGRLVYEDTTFRIADENTRRSIAEELNVKV